MPLPRHYTATLNFERQNAVASCILYYVSTAEPTADQIQPLAQMVYDHIDDQVRATLEPTTKFINVALRYSNSDARWEAASDTAPVAGTAAAGDVLPEDVAVCLQRRTGIPGRGRNGRIFWPFIPEAFALDSKLTAGAVTAYTALLNKLNVPISDVEGPPVTLSPRQPSFKTDLLLPIIAWRVLDNTVTRRDRRTPRRALPLGGGVG